MCNLRCSAVLIECDQYNNVNVPTITLCNIALHHLVHLYFFRLYGVGLRYMYRWCNIYE